MGYRGSRVIGGACRRLSTPSRGHRMFPTCSFQISLFSPEIGLVSSSNKSLSVSRRVLALAVQAALRLRNTYRGHLALSSPTLRRAHSARCTSMCALCTSLTPPTHTHAHAHRARTDGHGTGGATGSVAPAQKPTECKSDLLHSRRARQKQTTFRCHRLPLQLPGLHVAFGQDNFEKCLRKPICDHEFLACRNEFLPPESQAQYSVRLPSRLSLARHVHVVCEGRAGTNRSTHRCVGDAQPRARAHVEAATAVRSAVVW